MTSNLHLYSKQQIRGSKRINLYEKRGNNYWEAQLIMAHSRGMFNNPAQK